MMLSLDIRRERQQDGINKTTSRTGKLIMGILALIAEFCAIRGRD
jgi:hypothetical protein